MSAFATLTIAGNPVAGTVLRITLGGEGFPDPRGWFERLMDRLFARWRKPWNEVAFVVPSGVGPEAVALAMTRRVNEWFRRRGLAVQYVAEWRGATVTIAERYA